MKAEPGLVLGLLLCVAGRAFAGTTPVVAYTFLCKGSSAARTGPCPQGGRPNALIQGTDGNFYGTAQVSNEGAEAAGGTVFSLTPKGTFTVLHTFGGSNGDSDGNMPNFLIQGPDGMLYGETQSGGVVGASICPEGCGVLFRLNTDGSGFQALHEFCSATNCSDGLYPGNLAIGGDGNIYGITGAGGTNDTCTPYPGCGTLFQITPATGAYDVVFNFSYPNEYPANLVVAPDGTLYGMTVGALPDTLFHYTEASQTLDAFAMNFPMFNSIDPSSGRTLIEGPNGVLFGLYGIYDIDGNGLFEIGNDGSDLQLLPFFTHLADNGGPMQMLLGSDNNFYLADAFGSDNFGDLKQLSPTTGAATHTANFFGVKAAVGDTPHALIEASDGSLWGTTTGYGTATTGYFGDGTIYKINAGLPPRK